MNVIIVMTIAVLLRSRLSSVHLDDHKFTWSSTKVLKTNQLHQNMAVKTSIHPSIFDTKFQS